MIAKFSVNIRNIIRTKIGGERLKRVRRKMSQILGIILTVIMVIGVIPVEGMQFVMEVYAEETAPTSGTCGDNLTWELSEDGTLTISGTGEMENWTSASYLPWSDIRDNIIDIRIQNGVTTIGTRAFYSCNNLISVIIPRSISNIGDYAFYSCDNMNDITIPSNVSKIGDNAFDSCVALEKIAFEEGIDEIGENAFDGCSKLNNVAIPGSVMHIGSFAFNDCDNLQNLELEEGITCIDTAAFNGCDTLQNVVLPSSITEMGNSIFANCSELYEVKIKDGITNISSYAFYYCSSLTEIAIPNSVIEIGSSAFYNCNSLNNVDLGNGLEVIGNSAFTKCSNLTDITIPKSVITSDGAFRECNGLKNVILEDGFSSIGSSMFRECNNLENITIPDSVTKIGASAFYNCTSLKNIVIPKNVSDFNGTIFKNCTSLDTVVIEEGVKSIGNYVFLDCSSLLNISIPSSINNIGGRAFDGCYSLKNVYYGGSQRGWNEINIEEGNSYLTDATIHYNGKENDFDVNIYRTEILLDKSFPYHSGLEEKMGLQTPSGLYVSELQKSGFDSSTTAWTTLTTTFDAIDNPSSLQEFAVEGKDIYSAIILDILETSTEYGLVDTCESIINDSKSFVSEIRDLIKLEYDIDVADSYDFKNMTTEEQDIVKRFSEDYFKKYAQVDMECINDSFSKIGKVLNVADCFETYIERVSSAVALSQSSESLKAVVHTMEKQCPTSNLYLKLALADCVNIIDSSTEELFLKLYQDGWSVVGVEVSKYLVDELWDTVKTTLNATFPYLDIILAGYKTGTFISNTLFDTDSTIEQYCVMLAAIDVESLLYKTYQTLEKNYQSENSSLNAETYLTAVDVLYASKDKDCESAYQFVDILDKALATQLARLFESSEDDPWQGNKKSIDNIRQSYLESHETILTSWVHHLLDDYPELYDTYSPLLDESLERVVRKEYHAACPVDVFVYDQKDNLVAYVENNKAYSNGDITVAVENDTKTLYFYDDTEYRIEYVGNDSGKMDLTVTEYSNEGEKIRDAYFYNIPLTKGQSYTTNVDGKTLDDVSYSLESDNGTVKPDLDTNTTKVDKRNVKFISGNTIVNGKVMFETEAYPEEQLDIYAYVPDGYTFVGWSSNVGTDIFTDASSQITSIKVPDQDVTITAELKEISTEGGTITDDENVDGTTSTTERPLQPSGNENSDVSQTAPAQNNNDNVLPSVGTMLMDNRTNAIYRVTKAGTTVAYAKTLNTKAKKITIPSSVTIGNVTYKVTSIVNNAFKGQKKLKKVTIGANVTTIGKKAFSGCKSLKKVIIKSKKLKKVGAKAFANINPKAKIKVPKNKKKAYKKLFK